MRCSCAMMSHKDTSHVVERADAEGIERDEAEWEGGAVESDCRD